MTFELKPLPFSVDALEPYMDEKTVNIHHGKHHTGYVKKLNSFLENTELIKKDINWLLKNLDSVPEEIRIGVRNNAGGHANHEFFWEILSGKKMDCGEKTLKKIEESFGSFPNFKKEFTEKSVGFFGSGWCWLVQGENGLEIITTKEHDSPISLGKKPILVIDLWEHAYYLKYQNERNRFVEAFWNIVNWEKVEELFN